MAEGPLPSEALDPPPPAPFWQPPPAPPPLPPPPPRRRTRPYVGRPYIRRFRRDDRFDFCTICQETFTSGELINVLPCRHVFHISCIGQWLSGYRHNCPLCQQWTLPARPRREYRRRHRRWRHRRRRQREAREEAREAREPPRRTYRPEFWVRPLTVRTNN